MFPCLENLHGTKLSITIFLDDTDESALRQRSQSLVEQLGQAELREREEELQDRVALAANIAGVVSTRRDVLDYGDARGAAAGPRNDAGATQTRLRLTSGMAHKAAKRKERRNKAKEMAQED